MYNVESFEVPVEFPIMLVLALINSSDLGNVLFSITWWTHFLSDHMTSCLLSYFLTSCVLSGPHFVAVNNKNEIIVTDFHNHSVKVRLCL